MARGQVRTGAWSAWTLGLALLLSSEWLFLVWNLRAVMDLGMEHSLRIEGLMELVELMED